MIKYNSNFINHQIIKPSLSIIGCEGVLSLSTTNGTVINCLFQNNNALYWGDVYADYESDSVALIIKFYHIQDLVAKTLIYFDQAMDASAVNQFI